MSCVTFTAAADDEGTWISRPNYYNFITTLLLFLKHQHAPVSFTLHTISVSRCSLHGSPLKSFPSSKTFGVKKNYVTHFVLQLTQKFKTPLSSREASWNDNPDDSRLWNKTTLNQMWSEMWKRHIYNMTHSSASVLHNSCNIPYLPQMAIEGPLATTPLLH